MKNIVITSLMLIAIDVHGQPGSQTSFCKFVASYNQEHFDAIYNDLSDGFKTQVDRAVITGGLRHVFETNGPILSAVIERQALDEGAYVAIGDRGVFRVLLSIDSEERIDGLRIKALAAAPSQLPALVFNNVENQER
jgi:hypothetical protein